MFWLAMVSIALLLLTLLFPQLERRDEERPRTLTPPYVPRRQSEQPSMPAVTIVETPKTASLSRSVQTAYWSANTRLIRILLLVWGGSVFLERDQKLTSRIEPIQEHCNRTEIKKGFA